MTSPPHPDAQTVTQHAKDLGFGLCGITCAKPSDYADALKQWLAANKHGEMHYLANHLAVRLDPTVLLEGAQSVVALADFYPDEWGDPSQKTTGRQRGRVARYAWGDDYHKTIKKRLFQLADALGETYPEARFRCVVDTAPALEREHAQRAKLGWVGKHTLLIHPRHGSWMLLGLIVTTLKLTDDTSASLPGVADHCGTCTRCIEACPTQCITPYSVDAQRCLSYLTLEHRSLIDPGLHEAMGDWLAGCDVCQEVCPHNNSPHRLPLPLPIHRAYAPRPPSPSLDLMDILNWTEDDRRAAFTRSALKRIKLDMLKRNALIVAGNHLASHSDDALHQRITQLADDENACELVRLTAKQVLHRLASPDETADPGHT